MLSTIRKVQLIGKKKFSIAALDPDYEIFIIYITILNITFDICDIVHPSKKAQNACMKMDKTPIKVLSKDVNFVDVFLPKLVAKLFKH